MENIRKELGERIRIIRKANGLTQEELGEKAGLSYKFVGEIERGQVNPSLDTLVAIAKALDSDVEDLFRKNKDVLYQLSDKEIQTIKQALLLLSKAFPK
jgi:transcriptional regulator with XRE-family HTH domain